MAKMKCHHYLILWKRSLSNSLRHLHVGIPPNTKMLSANGWVNSIPALVGHFYISDDMRNCWAFTPSIFMQQSQRRVKHYHTTESVGITTGMLITTIHQAGLVSLTHTPSPMGFLKKLCERPANERPFLLLVVGYPADGAVVPKFTKKPLTEIASFI